MRVLLFVGAGSSVELGVPAMRNMAEQFVEHLREHVSGADALRYVEGRLAESAYDMENLIEELDNVAKGIATGTSWGISLPAPQPQDVGLIRQEAEWFVLHVCERIQPARAKRLWVPVLRASTKHDVTVATTNYDRAIEMGAGALHLALSDGFDSYGGREYAEWHGFGSATKIRLLKLHGSTDWYHTRDGASVVKLRHPMPLYGELTLALNTPGAPQLASAAVLPSREKKVTQAPYPKIAFELQSAARNVDVAFFVGTSLRDPDMRDVCSTCAERIPTFVISKTGAFAPGIVPSQAHVLRRTASRFLISVLPTFLHSQSVADLEAEPTGGSESTTENILELVTCAGDANRPTDDRCKAIEQLASTRVKLEREEVEELLDAEDPDVRLYALALIPDAPARDILLEKARHAASTAPDSAFARDLQLLETLPPNGD